MFIKILECARFGPKRYWGLVNFEKILKKIHEKIMKKIYNTPKFIEKLQKIEEFGKLLVKDLE